MSPARLLRSVPLVLVLLAGALVGLAAAKAPGTSGKARHTGIGATTNGSGNPRRTTTVQTTTVTTTVSSTTTTSATRTKKANQRHHAKKRPARKHARPPQRLSGWLGGAMFPMRSLILLPPTSTNLTAAMVHVTENGSPVSGLTVTPLSRAGSGSFGAIVVVAQGVSMNGQPLQQAMAGARALATHKIPLQALGLISFSQSPNLVLAPTSSLSAIDTAFSSTPGAVPGTRVLPALSLAYQQLAQLNVLAGAVILITDRAWTPAANDPLPDVITDAGQRAGIQTFAIGLKDAGYGQATRAALTQLDVPLIEASTAQLPGAVTRIGSQFTSGYLVTYRSHARARQVVSVQATVNQVPGAINATFKAPAPPAPPRRAGHSGTGAARHGPQRITLTPLPKPAATRHSFWTSPQSLLIVAGACALLIVVAISVLVSRHPIRRKVVGRIATFIEEPAVAAPLLSGRDDRAKGPRLLVHRKWWPGFVEQVDAARIQRPPRALVKLAVWGSLGTSLVIMVVTGSLALALIGLPVGPIVMRAFISRAARRQRDRFQQRLPSHLQDLAGAMRAGRSIVGAMSAVAEAADEPVKGEFERALADEHLGLPLEETLRAIARRMASEDMEQVALVAALNRRSGSNVAEALDRVAEGARERADLKRELNALTAQARVSGRLLTALPLVLLVAVSLVSPKYAQPLFHTAAGIVVLCICAFMVGMGWLVIRRIVEVEV